MSRGGIDWAAEPEVMPECWPEREYCCGHEAATEARTERRYITRRRADAEDEEALACESMPFPTRPPKLPARPVVVNWDWLHGAPAPPITIDRLFHPGVFCELQQGILKEVARKLRMTERRAVKG